MGIQINGLTDVISAGDGSLSIQGSDLTNLSQLSVTGVGTFKTLVLAADGSEKARIDSSGRLLVGTATGITSDTNSVIEATNALGAHVALGRLDGVINGGEVIGKLSFNSNDHDGAGTIWQECASITANADGAYSLNNKPTRLVFSTTSAGASSPTERLRITSAGRVGIGTTSPAAPLVIGSIGYSATDRASALRLLDVGGTNRNKLL